VAYLAWPDSGAPAVAGTFTLSGNGVLQSASFSADGKLLALVGPVGNGANMAIWDTVTRTYRAKLAVPTYPEEGEIGFSADDTQVTVIDQDEAVLRWDLTTGKRSVITPPGLKTSLLSLSGDGSTLAAPDSTAGGADVWDLRTGRLIAHLADPDSDPFGTAVVLDSAGRTLAVAGESHIYVWNVPGRKVIATLPYPPGASATGAVPLLSADGTGAVVDSEQSNEWFTLWDVAAQSNATPQDTRWPRKFAILYVAPAGAVCATQGAYQSLDLWNIATRTHIRTVGSPSQPVGYLFAVGPGGHEVLTTPHIRAQNHVATLWDIP